GGPVVLERQPAVVQRPHDEAEARLGRRSVLRESVVPGGLSCPARRVGWPSRSCPSPHRLPSCNLHPHLHREAPGCAWGGAPLQAVPVVWLPPHGLGSGASSATGCLTQGAAASGPVGAALRAWNGVVWRRFLKGASNQFATDLATQPRARLNLLPSPST